MVSEKKIQYYDDVEELIDLRAVWVGLRRRAGLFAAVTMTVFAAVVAFTFLSTNLYTAETSLMIQPKSEVFAYGEDIFPQLTSDPMLVDTEVELLRSRAMAIRVANRMRSMAAGGLPVENNNSNGKTENDFFTRRLADVAADLAVLQSSDRNLDESLSNVEGNLDESVEADEPAAKVSDKALNTEVETTTSEAPNLSLAVGPIDIITGEGDAELGVKNPTAATAYARDVEKLLKQLEILRVGSTFLIKVRYSAPHADEAAAIANAYAEEYILQQLEAQYAALRSANQWIDARLGTLRKEVRSAEEAAAKYSAEHGLVDVTGATFSEKALTGIAAELAAARTNLASLTARYNTARSLAEQDAPVESINEVMSSQIIADLRRQQAEINRRRAEMKVRYGSRHPEVKKINEEAAQIDVQVETEVARIVNNLRAEVGFAQAQVTSLENSLKVAQGDMASNNVAVAKLLELERDIDATRGVYEALLNRQKELNERDRLADANARIIARAEPPEKPSKPRKKLLLAGGLVLGFLLGGATSFAAEALDTRIKNTNDLRREFGASAPVVLIPRIQSRLLFRHRKSDDVVRKYIQEEPDSTFAESMRDLRLYLKSAEREVEGSVSIAFTSVFKGEGKTTTAFAFASLLSAGGRRVAFIDCHRSSHNYMFEHTEPVRDFHDGDEEGPVKFLESKHRHASDGDAIPMGDASAGGDKSGKQSTGDLVNEIRGRAVMTHAAGGEIEAYDLRRGKTVCGVVNMEFDGGHSYDDFDIASFTKTLERMQDDFDYIIIDAPAVLVKPEASVIASSADFTVLIAEWCETSRGAVRAAAQRLLDARARILSFAITKVDERQRYYFRPEDRQFYFRKPN